MKLSGPFGQARALYEQKGFGGGRVWFGDRPALLVMDRAWHGQIRHPPWARTWIPKSGEPVITEGGNCARSRRWADAHEPGRVGPSTRSRSLLSVAASWDCSFGRSWGWSARGAHGRAGVRYEAFVKAVAT